MSVAGSDPRQRLLDAAIGYVSDHGLADLSLRRLAEELGTSHRMLIHHFGSKDGLWVAIVREVERQQLEQFRELQPAPGESLDAALRAWWRHISDPSFWPNERLFFEVYSQALHGRAPANELLEGVVDTWVDAAAAISVAMGVPDEVARASARLGLAVSRGLLLDLLATGDRAGVDAAMDLWIDTFAGERRPRRRRR